MNSDLAKQILAYYRPGLAEEKDGQLAEALEQTQHDPELRQWFEKSCAFHAALREKFRQIPVPPDLKESILAANKIIRPVWSQKRIWLAAAAVFALFLGLSALWLQPPAKDRFRDYRIKIVRTALRQYHMDIVTNNLDEIRHFLAGRGSPADYVLPSELEKLSATGGGSLQWRGHPVSMLCFDRGDKQMLFLFVLDRLALKDAPSSETEVAKINKLLTTSWTQGDKTYILAGPEDSSLLRKRF